MIESRIEAFPFILKKGIDDPSPRTTAEEDNRLEDDEDVQDVWMRIEMPPDSARSKDSGVTASPALDERLLDIQDDEPAGKSIVQEPVVFDDVEENDSTQYIHADRILHLPAEFDAQLVESGLISSRK